MNSLNSQLIYLDDKVNTHILAAMFGVNQATIYADIDKGRFGDPKTPLNTYTYRQVLNLYRNNLIKGVEVKIIQEQAKVEQAAEKERQKNSKKFEKVAGENGADDLFAKKIIQEIKTKRAQETQVWLKIAQDKNNLPNYTELKNLLMPFMSIIKNQLTAIALDKPETSESIQQCFDSLAKFGETLLEATKQAESVFVAEFLAKTIDDDLAELRFLPEDRNDI
jgi:hypothetical protein